MTALSPAATAPIAPSNAVMDACLRNCPVESENRLMIDVVAAP